MKPAMAGKNAISAIRRGLVKTLARQLIRHGQERPLHADFEQPPLLEQKSQDRPVGISDLHRHVLARCLLSTACIRLLGLRT